MRFHGSHAYLTDDGSPGLIVLDLTADTGEESSTAIRRCRADIHADQLEVSPNGEWLYYQACSGSLWRMGTKFLDDPSLTDAQLSSYTQPFADTPSTDGAAMAADGTIYLSE